MQKKRGISLIVLVITIIVMIVLAAAIIISLNNSGIIGRASEAVKEYNEDEVNHVASLAWSEAYINGARTVEALTAGVRAGLTEAGLNPDDYGMIVTTKGVTITKGWLQDGVIVTKGNVILEAGDLIQYNAGVTGYEGAWKVLGAEDGNLLVMSTEDVNTLKLYGLEGNGNDTNYGLLNGVQRLNMLCEPFGNGEGAVGARSIKVEDIDKLTGYDKTTFGENTLREFGNKVTYSWNGETDGKVDYTATNGKEGTLRITYNNGFSYVNFATNTKTTVGINENGMPMIINNLYEYIPTTPAKISEMLFKKNNNNLVYWLASSFVGARYSFSVEFGLQIVFNSCITYSTLFDSSDGECLISPKDVLGVHAVVKLSPNITIGTNDVTNGWSYTI